MDPAATPCDLKTDHLPHAYDTLRFESRFESGNLGKVVRITETYYELHLRPDFYTSKHCQWFYFQVGTQRSIYFSLMLKQDAMENFVFPDEIKTKLMK